MANVISFDPKIKELFIDNIQNGGTLKITKAILESSPTPKEKIEDIINPTIIPAQTELSNDDQMLVKLSSILEPPVTYNRIYLANDNDKFVIVVEVDEQQNAQEVIDDLLFTITDEGILQ